MKTQENDKIEQEKKEKIIKKVSGWRPSKITSASPLIQVDYEIILTENSEAFFVQQGIILNIKKMEDAEDYEKFLNLEMIEKLEWKGKYDEQGQRFGKWKGYWANEQTKLEGIYNKGQKLGIWIEPWQNYWSGCIVTFEGQYDEIGRKVENWKYRNEQNAELGGGYFNNDGLKIGIWKELHISYNENLNQSTIRGLYNKGIRQGEWVIEYNNKYIGGGQYDFNGQKIGMWTEQIDRFWNHNQSTLSGRYNNSGMKSGQWEIYWYWNGINKKIGGGYYNDKGNKIGQWIEQIDGFWNYNQTTLIGNYSEQGKKTGIWEIYFLDSFSNKPNNRIGGGQYNEEGIKNGRWEEISDEYWSYNQSIYIGEYKQGQKIGVWELIFKDYITANFQKIGDGEYDQQGIKIGLWVEQVDGFNYWNQSIIRGTYNNQGIKEGKWEINWNWNGETYKIGGGQYDDFGHKTGVWIEQKDDFECSKKYILEGEYHQGIKLGQWEESEIL
ncbi:unnamed protein product [Paramecium sonneborni]|uniref:Uncharacterized protein n=1 Tax=Paramecium sonneborni TaxID=65129 RepID=A0A8S1PFY7_9CILI|nr:unnamed protein product [Paramecium sonneborni]